MILEAKALKLVEMYYNRDFFKDLEIKHNAVMLSPVKAIKGQTLQKKQIF